MGSGRVIEATWRGNRGNVIVIEHDHNGAKIYSSYAHLGTMFVRIGDSVDANQLIAEVGDTGNAFGTHLHRQLDINQNGVYPFHFFNCPGSLTEIVNDGLCRNQLIANTLDPIAFVEEQIRLREQTLPRIPFSFAGFRGGYTQLDKLQLLHIRQDDPNRRLNQPIRISFDREKVSIFPQELAFI
jgi:murein DD-endopeptidase MepM/ murein hydrolase activator NlpD